MIRDARPSPPVPEAAGPPLAFHLFHRLSAVRLKVGPGNEARVSRQDSPQVEQADEGVKDDVGRVVAPRLELVQHVVGAEGEHRERPVRLVALLL